jgi:hypothetical protein
MLNATTLRNCRVERRKRCLQGIIVISNKALRGNVKLLKKLMHSIDMLRVMLVIFATYKGKAYVVYCVVHSNANDVKE